MPFTQPQSCRLSVERRVVGEGMAYIKRYAWYAVVALICGGWLCMSSPVSAEWFGDLYGGVAFPENVTAQFDQSLPAPAKATRTYAVGNSPTFGVRAGYWFGKPYREEIVWPFSSHFGLALKPREIPGNAEVRTEGPDNLLTIGRPEPVAGSDAERGRVAHGICPSRLSRRRQALIELCRDVLRKRH